MAICVTGCTIWALIATLNLLDSASKTTWSCDVTQIGYVVFQAEKTLDSHLFRLRTLAHPKSKGLKALEGFCLFPHMQSSKLNEVSLLLTFLDWAQESQVPGVWLSFSLCSNVWFSQFARSTRQQVFNSNICDLFVFIISNSSSVSLSVPLHVNCTFLKTAFPHWCIRNKYFVSSFPVFLYFIQLSFLCLYELCMCLSRMFGGLKIEHKCIYFWGFY